MLLSLLIVTVLIFSIIVHEVAHGVAALFFGDTTARDQGRLTLNPLPHFDPIGSFVLPLLLLVVRSPILIGWARPVPFSEENLSPRRLGILCVTLAGVVVNFIIAGVGALILRLCTSGGSVETLSPFFLLVVLIVLVNLALGMLNLLPIPPLDGHRLITVWFPDELRMHVERYSFLGFFLLVLFVMNVPIAPMLFSAFTWLTGVTIV